MIKRRAPKCVWGYGMVYESDILSRISQVHYSRTGMDIITGDMVHNSKWIDFEFYGS